MGRGGRGRGWKREGTSCFLCVLGEYVYVWVWVWAEVDDDDKEQTTESVLLLCASVVVTALYLLAKVFQLYLNTNIVLSKAE